MLKPLIGVINLSTKIKNADITTMVIAIQEQLNVAAELWNQIPPFIIFYEDRKAVSLRAFQIAILDSPDTPQALGYHAENNFGKPYGRVFVDPILNNGGTILFDHKNSNHPTVSNVLSHEALELTFDKYANFWADNNDGYSYALEICDPVQENFYESVVKKQTVSLSNFILPDWFNTGTNNLRYDYLNMLSHSFEIAPGGYAIVRDSNQNTMQIFNTTKPKQWILDMKKLQNFRFSKRMPTKKLLHQPWWKFIF